LPATARQQHQGAGTEPRTPRASPLAAPETHYRLLGVPYTASRAEITRAYREAMKRVHPDRQSGPRRVAAEEQAKRLNEAYATLSKPPARQAYDRCIQQEIVQDEIMNRYVGGFGTGVYGAPGSTGHDAWRGPTDAERRDRILSDRNALASLLVVFGGITCAVIVLLVLWSALGLLLAEIF
jgi:DnaJ-domain-containing protein 1